MSSLIFTTKRSVAGCLSALLRWYAPQLKPGGRIVTFHAIETPVDGDVNGIYNMRMETFAAHVRAILEFVQASERPQLTSFGVDFTKSVSITFDDGYSSTLTQAAPLLVRYSVPCHVFVSPQLIQSSDRRYLDIAQLKALSELPGFTIGAHGYKHIPLSAVPEHERLSQLSAARKWLEDILQKSVDTMSYPFGDTPKDVQSLVHQAGYTTAASSIWGFNNRNTNPFMLRRIDFWDGDSEKTATLKLLGYWNWMSRGSST